MAVALTVEVHFQPGTLPQAVAFSKDVIASSKANEKGCNAYFFFASAETPDVQYGIESYNSQADVEAHTTSPAYQGFHEADEKSGIRIGPPIIRVGAPVCGYLARKDASGKTIPPPSGEAIALATVSPGPEVEAKLAQIAQELQETTHDDDGVLSFWVQRSIFSMFEDKPETHTSKIYIFARFVDEEAGKKLWATPQIKALGETLEGPRWFKRLSGYLAKDEP